MPTRMGFANTLAIFIVQDRMFRIYTSMTRTKLFGNVDGSIMSKATAFAN